MKSRSAFKRIGAIIMALALAMGGLGFGGENIARADLAAGTATPVPPLSDEELEKKIRLALEYYAIKQQEIAAYKEELKKSGCQEINLDFCAGVLYAIEKCDGFRDPQLFDRWQESILGNHITTEQVYEFGKTGRGLDVVYFRDRKGEKTKEPAICYVANAKNRKFRVSDVEKAIAFWEKRAPGFLRAVVANDVRILFQSQASSNNRTQIFKYEDGIFYYNISTTDSGIFINGVTIGLPVEMFGVKGSALFGEFDKYVVGVIKSRMAADCCEYVAKKADREIAYLIEEYQLESDEYTKAYWTDRGKSEQELLSLIRKIKDNCLMTPFGAETWEEIDSVKQQN